MSGFFHGIEHIETAGGTRSVAIDDPNIIGIVGTADYADPDKYPLHTPVLITTDAQAAQLWSEAGAEDGKYLSQTLAHHVPQIRRVGDIPIVVVRVPTTETAALAATLTTVDGPFALADGETLAIVVSGQEVDITLDTADFSDISAATPAELQAVLDLELDAAPVTVSVDGDVVALVTTDTGANATIEVLSGTAAAALGWTSADVAGLDAGVDESATAVAVVGGVNVSTDAYEGVSALRSAAATTGVKPKIFVATGWGTNAAVRAALIAEAQRVGGVTPTDGVDGSMAEVLADRASLTAREVYPFVYPHIQTLASPLMNSTDLIESPGSAIAAAMVASVNYSQSPSNRIAVGVYGVTRDIDYASGDRTSRANILNASEITTWIYDSGWRLWGNRTLSDDSRYAFINAVRTNFALRAAIDAAISWAQDRNISGTFVEDTVESAMDWVRVEKAAQRLVGAEVYVDPAKNPTGQLSAGQVVFSYRYTPFAPAELMTAESEITDDFYADIFSEG